MFHKLSFKIFWIILAILSFVFLFILIFIIYIIPNIYHNYSLEQSKQYLDALEHCVANKSSCTDANYIIDEYFFYVENNDTGEKQVFESTTNIPSINAYGSSTDFVIPKYEFTSKDIVIDNVSYTMYIEVKNIDTSFFKKFIIPLFVIVIIIAIITSFIISRLFAKPVKTINQQIKELENLNFSNSLYVSKKDELGEISNALVKLNDVISLGISSIEAEKKNSDDFLKIMSHELKTPLTVVRGYNELLIMDNQLTSKQINYLDISIDEIDKMTQLINNSIISSKLDSLKEKSNYEMVEMTKLVNDEIKTYAKIYPHVKLNTQINSLKLQTNPDILKLAVKNIIENAYLHHHKNTAINITLDDNYFEVTNVTTNVFNPTQIMQKDSKNLGVYIIITALQLLGLKYQFTLVDNQVTFKIILTK